MKPCKRTTTPKGKITHGLQFWLNSNDPYMPYILAEANKRKISQRILMREMLETRYGKLIPTK